MHLRFMEFNFVSPPDVQGQEWRLFEHVGLWGTSNDIDVGLQPRCHVAPKILRHSLFRFTSKSVVQASLDCQDSLHHRLKSTRPLSRREQHRTFDDVCCSGSLHFSRRKLREGDTVPKTTGGIPQTRFAKGCGETKYGMKSPRTSSGEKRPQQQNI